MDARAWLVCGAILGGMAVALGALGAHGLEARLKPGEDATAAERESAEKRLHNFEVGVRYQTYHALALVLVGLVMLHAGRTGWLSVSAWLFLIGIGLFSGMLYAWVFAQERWMVMLVPIGGTSFILGWIALAVGALAVRSGQ